jgi:hypothetical protein
MRLIQFILRAAKDLPVEAVRRKPPDASALLVEA